MKTLPIALALSAVLPRNAAAQDQPATPRAPFDILGALPDNPQDGTRLEAAVVYRDLRLYQQAVLKKRATLEQTAVGAAFYGEKGQIRAFGFDPLAEVVRLIELASPKGGAVPAGIAAFSSPTGVGIQLLMKVEPGFLERVEKALASPNPPPWSGKVSNDALVIQIQDDVALTGQVGSDGWFRMAPDETMLVGGQGRNPFVGTMDKWTADLDGLVVLQGGGMAASKLALETSGIISELLQAMRSAVIGWRFDGDRTWTTRLLVDIPPLESLVAAARQPDLENTLAHVWDDDAAGFLSLSLPPAITGALVPLAERELPPGQMPEGIVNGLADLNGRIGFVAFAPPGDWALGIGFRNAATARAVVPALQEFIIALGMEMNADLSENYVLEQVPAGAGDVLHLRADTGLEGWRVAAVDNTVVVSRKHRLAALVEKARAREAKQPDVAKVAGPVTPPIRESFDTPGIVLGYLLLSTEGGLFDYLAWASGSLEHVWRQLANELPDSEIVPRLIDRVPTYLVLEGINWTMMYDLALWADLERSVVVIQVHNSEI